MCAWSRTAQGARQSCRIRHARWAKHYQPIWTFFEAALGIVFVAMKRNIADLLRFFNWPAFGAYDFMVTNVCPTADAGPNFIFVL
jgi:hypothetical protein